MDEHRIFVGRKDELDRFKQLLQDPRGQAIIVVGGKGRGKSWLVDKMTEEAEDGLDYHVVPLRYSVTPTDPVGTVMNEIMNNAADAIWSLRGKAVKLVGKTGRNWRPSLTPPA